VRAFRGAVVCADFLHLLWGRRALEDAHRKMPVRRTPSDLSPPSMVVSPPRSPPLGAARWRSARCCHTWGWAWACWAPPWLFHSASTSSSASAPPVSTPADWGAFWMFRALVGGRCEAGPGSGHGWGWTAGQPAGRLGTGWELAGGGESTGRSKGHHSSGCLRSLKQGSPDQAGAASQAAAEGGRLIASLRDCWPQLCCCAPPPPPPRPPSSP
jgi:hypothetical protein